MVTLLFWLFVTGWLIISCCVLLLVFLGGFVAYLPDGLIVLVFRGSLVVLILFGVCKDCVLVLCECIVGTLLMGFTGYWFGLWLCGVVWLLVFWVFCFVVGVILDVLTVTLRKFYDCC